jgi:predicted DNA-binding transcriptional regulator AlpA
MVGQAEVAEMAGTKSSTVGVWVTRGKLPEPVAALACGKIWLRSDIEAWLKTR